MAVSYIALMGTIEPRVIETKNQLFLTLSVF